MRNVSADIQRENSMVKLIRRHLSLAFITVVGFVLTPPSFSAPVAYGQQRYQENPTLRKSKGRDALTKAMTLNAQVAVMLHQGSEQIDDMVRMLGQSYGHQVAAIAQAEGIVREVKFKDPIMERSILEMYEEGKPPTMMAQSQIKGGDYDSALASLAVAKRTHQKFMTVLY